MKVLLRRNVPKLGQIGDLVEVKPGYARNYLLPQQLAVEPTPGNLKAVEVEKKKHLDELARLRKEVEARAKAVEGKEVTITARANEEGQLYGSVGPAQVAEALTREGVFVEADNVALDEPIKRLDKFDVTLKFAQDVTATVHVWVVPDRESQEAAEAARAAQAQAEAEAEQSGDE